MDDLLEADLWEIWRERNSAGTTLPPSRLLACVTCPDCGALSVDSSCPSKLLRLRRFEDVGPD